MTEYLVLLLVFTLLTSLAWVLRRRLVPGPWRNRKYRAVLDALEDGILVFGQDGQLIFVNEAARTWFGIDITEDYDTQAVHAQISPENEFLALLGRGGEATLQIGSRHVEAVSQRIDQGGAIQIALLLHDVTAARALLTEERRRSDERAVLDEVDQSISANLSLNSLLGRILERLGRLSPYTSAAISVWDAKSEQLFVRGCVGPGVEAGAVLPSNKGFAARLVREREPLLVRDTSQQSDAEIHPTIRSYAAVPLQVGNIFVGTLELFSDQAGAFSADTLDTLLTVSRYLSVAIENTRLHSEVLLRAEEMATMNTLSAAINASLNLDELLEIIVYSVSQAIECDRSAVFLMDNERGILHLAKSRGLSDEFVRQNQSIKPELGGQGQVVLDRYPLVVSDIQHVEAPAKVATLLEQEGIAAFVDLPLRGREHVLGALTVYYDRPRKFDESELELLRAIANQITLALENARLYERTDRALARRVDQLAAIEEIGRELTSTLDITRVFNLVLQRAMGSTGAAAGFLALCDASSEELELIVDSGYPEDTLDRYKSNRWPTNHGVVGRVARTGETALINDIKLEPNHTPFLPSTLAQLIVPIVKEARVLGVVSLESSRPNGFSHDDVRFTTQLAELAAIAIDNARLFQQVRDGRDNLQAILDSTHDGILVIGRDERIVLANPMIEEMSGLSAHSLVGRCVRNLIAELGPRALTLLGYSDSELDEVMGVFDVTSDRVTKRRYELPGPHARQIEQMALPVIDKDRVVVGRLVVFRDVTEEHRLAIMRQNLSDMIIHDLRSPLTAVIGGVQVAGDLTEISADPAAIQHALEMASQSCDRLMSLVDSLLDISRLEAGQMPLERQPILLHRLTQSVAQQMTPLAERGRVTIKCESADDVPPADADNELISRVLVNLVDNAIKHAPPKSTVSIRVASASADGEQGATSIGNQLVRCTVLDMGPGIPIEFRQRVFERFAQLDDRRKGTGLGLSFCQLAIHAHGGRIWVEDNPNGQGSAFIFTLPTFSNEILSPTTLKPAS